jgi:DNA repair photolyase
MARRAEFVPYRPRTILNKHKRPDHWFWTRYTAYPYKGCMHGCEFCYRLPCVQVRVSQTPLNKYTSSRRFQK